MRKLVFLLLILIIASSAEAQGRRYKLIGIQPGASMVYMDPLDPLSQIDINVVPIIFQIPINTVTDFKLATIGNYRYGGDSRISEVGFQVVFPRYFEGKERFSEKSMGWYLGPLVSGLRGFYSNLWEARAALEFGHYSEAKRGISFYYNLQAGGAYQVHPNKPPRIAPFAGINLGVGFWYKDKVALRGGSI